MPEEIVGRILRLPGYRVCDVKVDDERATLVIWVKQAGGTSHTCSGCGVEREDVHDFHERRVRDLPWGAWKVWLIVEVHRVRCRQCGVRTERINFLDGKQPYTRRFAAAVARDCEDTAVNRVALKWGLSSQTARRIDKRALQRWHVGRRRRPLHYMGVDEFYWQKGKFITIVSDLELGEPIWTGPDRGKEALDRFFVEHLPPRQRRSVRAVCIDLSAPYAASIREHLPHAAIVFDKFHVMAYVSKAVESTRKQEIYRHIRRGSRVAVGKRWLLLKRWHNLTPSRRTELSEALQRNRRLFKAYYLKEQIDQLWSYKYRAAAERFFREWLRSLRWQRLPAFKRLAARLVRYMEGILAYCEHKVPLGLVEAINGNLRAIIRRGRGYRDLEYLLLKAKKTTADRRARKAA